MSAVQYPFIDIAVHPRIRARLSAGEAVVIFSPDMKHALWANGRGAELFGHESIYDFLDNGTAPVDVSFRQAEAAARSLKQDGDSRSFVMRVTNGFQRSTVQASCERITIGQDEAILVAAPVTGEPMSTAQCAARMIEGFDDSDTHRAVVDQNGQILAASPRFSSLDLTPHTARMLVNMAAVHTDGLVKRPVPTRLGYLPAAMGKVSDTPALHLLFIVEPDAGSAEAIPMEPRDADLTEKRPLAAAEAIGVAGAATALEAGDAGGAAETADAAGTEISAPSESLAPDSQTQSAVRTDPLPASADPESDGGKIDGYADALDALADIADVDDEPAEEDEFAPVSAPLEGQADTDKALADVRQALLDSFGAEGAGEAAAVEETQQAPAGDLDDEAEPAAHDPDAVMAHGEPAGSDVSDTDPGDALIIPAVAPAASAAPEPSATPSAMFGKTRTASAEPFVFSPDMRATRFVWKIDAEGRFSEVSGEFARVVGPHAADINGLAFSDLAALFNFDPDGKITELLRKRDTWSGKTIWWPIEGTTLKVPVDLAALPTYTRSREFDGFRGFGIVRVADAAEDPLAIGITLVPTATVIEADPTPAEASEHEAGGSGESTADTPALAAGPDAETIAAEDAVEDAPPVAVEEDNAPAASNGAPPSDAAPDDATSGDAGSEDATAADTAPDDYAFSTLDEEKPALRFADTPVRRHSDKIIRFEERRFRKDGLTPGEQAAFAEIGRRLDLQSAGNDESEDDGPAVAAYANENVPRDRDRDSDVTDVTPDAGAPGQDADATAVEDMPQDDEEAGHEDAVIVGTTEDAASVGTDTGAEEAVSDLRPLLDQAGEDADEAERFDTEDEGDKPQSPADDRQSYGEVIPVRPRLGLTPEILDQMPVALVVHAGDKLYHANAEFLRLTGYESLQQLEELGGLDVLLQRDELEAKTAEAGGMVVVRADDALIPVSARLQSIRWEQSTALMLALMPVTATAPAPAQVAQPLEPAGETDEDDDMAAAAAAAEVSRLQVEVDELRSILETATDGVVIIGAEGDIRSMNRAASALFNYDNDETAGRPFVMLFAHESQRSVIDYLGGLSGHGVASVLNDGREVIGREAAGGFLPLFMTIGRLTSSSGYCAVIRDITAWKRTEEELRNAKRAAETANAHKSDFLAHVSHEIRTPLNAIIGFADMMATERFGPIGHPRYIEYANDIGRSGRHVLDIVNDLLDISKIEAGEMDLEFEAVGLNETVSETVSIIQPQANGQRVIIRTALSQAVPQVVADLRSIKQIVLNVLSNAIRFTPSGGQIVVSTAFEANGSVALRIRDTGIGMTRSELELAMKPFRQVTGAARKRGDGTGLGLPLTKAMVDANRASFAITSAPNEGTLVEITFPSPRVLAD